MGKHHSENSVEIPPLGTKKSMFPKYFHAFVLFLYSSFIKKKYDLSRFCRALRLNSPPSSEEGRDVYIPFHTKTLRFLRH